MAKGALCVLVFHRCLQTLSLLFLQEAIEDGVGSLELRVRENVKLWSWTPKASVESLL